MQLLASLWKKYSFKHLGYKDGLRDLRQQVLLGVEMFWNSAYWL